MGALQYMTLYNRRWPQVALAHPKGGLRYYAASGAGDRCACSHSSWDPPRSKHTPLGAARLRSLGIL